MSLLYKVAASYANSVGNSNVRISTDNGVTWTTSTADASLAARSITSNSTGSFMAVASFNTNVYTSTNYGSNFTPSVSGFNFWNVVSNGDGSFLVGYTLTNIYKSTNSGASWDNLKSTTDYWQTADVSKTAGGSGYTIVAGDSTNIYTSTNSGANWTTSTVPGGISTNWFGVTCSADGTKMAACSNNSSTGAIIYSSDSGGSWSLGDTGGTTGFFKPIASSNDGTILYCCQQNSGIWKSINSGANWTFTSLNKSWNSIECSTDGTFAVAVPSGDYIYTYTNGGVWTEQTGSGSNSWVDVTIYATPVSSITATPSPITNLLVNNTQQLTVTVLPSDATNKVVTYTSSNTAIATVSATGLVTGVAVGGPVTITISATDGSGIFTTVIVQSVQFCFRGTTRVIMWDRTLKAIKDIERGEEILTDKKTGYTKKVARVISCFRDGSATHIPMHLIGNRRTIVCSSTHPFWISDTRRILAGDIEGVETIEISEWLYTIQFEDEGTYYVEGVKVDAISPDHRKVKLPKELYFDETKYKANRVMKSEDDERRKKPNMTKNL